MSMQAESLEVLEKASVAPAQARAIVRAIEIEIAGAKDTLATKNDVLALRFHAADVHGAAGAHGHDARVHLFPEHAASIAKNPPAYSAFNVSIGSIADARRAGK
jgi:hypothetical protein